MRVLNKLLVVLVLLTCTSGQSVNMEEKPVLIYLHGMIIENMGLKANHAEYGDYEFENILETFRKEGFEVIGEVREKDTDVSDYADHVVEQVNMLIRDGQPPEQITIVGASKGSMIAMVASTRLLREDVNFVFMGACNEWVGQNLGLNPCGRILSIYEDSDEIGRSCNEIVKNGDCVSEYKEIMITTGRKHGFLFHPLPEWVGPVLEWSRISTEEE